MRFLLPLLVAAAALIPADGFNYMLTSVDGISLTDIATSIENIRTIFTGEAMDVLAIAVAWEANPSNVTNSNNTLRCETYVDDELASVVFLDLSTLGERELPTEISCGTITVEGSGARAITVSLVVDDSSATYTNTYQAFAAGVSIIPLIVVLFLAVTTQMVEFSLFFAVFVGACMVTGNISDGFKTTLDEYILGALADVDHGYVYLFTMFLSGMVSVVIMAWLDSPHRSARWF
jgi:hypothetical protein